jgi:hypothetical protein
MSEKVVSAGDHIASKCTKCKDTTNHTIVAMVAEKVVRVQCNTCSSTHNYRAETKKKLPASRSSSTGPARRASAATSRTTNKAQRDWDVLLEDAKPEEATPYSMNTPMKEGLLIMHPTFGLGQVLSITRPNKMDVRFQSGVKLLRCKLG